jgi:hypothetical protein
LLAAVSLGAALTTLPAGVRAQAVGQGGYAAVAVDGIADVGAHFALVPTGSGAHTGLFYLADRRELWSGRCTDFGGCSIETRVSPAGADHGRFPSLAMRAGNRPIGAYYDADLDEVRLVNCFDSECLNVSTRAIDAVGADGGATAIAVDPATGFAAVAFRDSGGSLSFHRCADFDCTNGSTLVIDAGPGVGNNPSMAFGADGRVYIAYDDGPNALLKLATAPAASPAFTTATAGGGSDAVVTVPGTTPVLYYRDGFATLKRRNCAITDCSLGTESNLTPLVFGAAPSVVFAAGGLPVISHRNENTGEVYITRCADTACTQTTRLSLDAQPDAGRVSQVVLDANGRPRVFWHRATRSALFDARCNDTGCTGAGAPQLALNGPSVRDPAIAMRADGRPVVQYRIGRGSQMLALCADVRCTSLVRRELPSANSLDRGAVLVRNDNRPLAYYGSVGGTVAYDCANVDCSSGISREITPVGSGTSAHVAAVLRSDNRPLLVYIRRQPAQPVQWRVFVCADEGCASGTDRLLASEDPTSVVVQGAAVRAVVGPGNRLILVYATAPANFSSYSTRYVRCTDPDCTSVSTALIGNAQVLDAPIALRSDGRIVFRENLSPNPVLGTCGSTDCPGAGVVRVTLPIGFRSSRSIMLDADRPVFDAALTGQSGLDRCVDAACSAITYTPLIADPELPNRSFTGTLERDAQLRPVAVWAESTLADVWLSVPLPNAIFANGFEP